MSRIPITVIACLALAACSADSESSATDNPVVGRTDFPDSGVSLDSGIDPATLDHFSFFVTSLSALQALSGDQNGFGGDLRYGESGAGAGLRGADKLCATIAERSMPGASSKRWRAFLSAVSGADGNQVDAIDRIGSGPWYDRLGRLVAPNLGDLVNSRPLNGDATIRVDLPNEDGVPNHAPDPIRGQVDNHDTLTGSNDQGRLFSTSATCRNWTAATGESAEGKPRLGHSWPRGGGSGRGGSGADATGWIAAHEASGCAAGVNLADTGGPSSSSTTVGAGGGYGGFYCFALTP